MPCIVLDVAAFSCVGKPSLLKSRLKVDRAPPSCTRGAVGCGGGDGDGVRRYVFFVSNIFRKAFYEVLRRKFG